MAAVRATELPEGVYYRRQDYAGFWRRLAVDSIDFLVVILLCIAALAVSPVWFLRDRQALNLMLAICAVVFFCYFVILKRSRFRTLGYRICGVRIVDIHGRTPAWPSLTLRLAFIFLGPLNYLCDMAFASGDENKQAVRDKFASTYVIKAAAQPAGSGPVVFQHYHLLGFSFLFREIRRGQASR